MESLQITNEPLFDIPYIENFYKLFYAFYSPNKFKKLIGKKVQFTDKYNNLHFGKVIKQRFNGHATYFKVAILEKMPECLKTCTDLTLK